MFFMANIDYHIWQKFAVPAYITALLLSVAVLIVGDEYNGSKRWLSFGPLSFQPSEFAKIAVILFLACVITKNVRKMKKMRYLLFVMLLILPIVGLVGASNLSTAIIILGIGAVLVFVASPKYAQFVWLCVSGAGFMGIFLALESYRLERLAIWRNPEKYEKGYQTLQGLFAIGSGGLFGRGLGASVQKLGFVPEAQNDMIFSIVCEELGLVGASFIILLFLILIWRFFMIATHAKDLFGALIASGAMAHMMIQVILNIAVVTNTIPNTGITLPFISYGGTSVSCHQHDSKYRNHAAVYQLWRNFGYVSSIRNGTCPECIESDRIEKKRQEGKDGAGKRRDRRKTEKKKKKEKK